MQINILKILNNKIIMVDYTKTNKDFKRENNTLERRLEVYQKFVDKFPEHYPIILVSKDFYLDDKYKYSVPSLTTMAQFSTDIRRKIYLQPNESFYFMVREKKGSFMMLRGSNIIDVVYNTYREPDGFFIFTSRKRKYFWIIQIVYNFKYILSFH